MSDPLPPLSPARPPLDYDQPLYVGVYAYTLQSVGVFVLFGGVMIVGAYFLGGRGAGRLPVEVKAFMGVIAAVVGAIATLWLIGYQRTFAFYRDALVQGGRRRAWNDIGSVFALYDARGEHELAYTRRHGALVRGLPVDVPLTRADCEEIFDRLREQVLPAHPHLDIGTYRERQESGS